MKEELLQHLDDWTRLKEIAHEEFIRAMRTGRMIAFVGSYISKEFGYPEWGSMLADMLGKFKAENRKITDDPRLETLRESLKKTGADTVVDFDLLVSYCAGGREDKQTKLLKNYAKVVRARHELATGCVNGNSIKALCDDLGISRIITLNYDIEFEYHLMADHSKKGYGTVRHRKRFIKELSKYGNNDRSISHYDYQLQKTMPDGRHIVSDCFHRERADRLFEFSIGSPDFSNHIMHLHGRIGGATCG